MALGVSNLRHVRASRDGSWIPVHDRVVQLYRYHSYSCTSTSTLYSCTHAVLPGHLIKADQVTCPPRQTGISKSKLETRVVSKLTAYSTAVSYDSMNSYIDSSNDSASPPSSFGPTRQHATSIDSLGSPALHYHATLTANQPALLFSRFGNWVAQPHLLAISGGN